MKKIALLLLTIVTVSSNAQNLTTFGLSGNANNLTHNPAADPLTSFHLNYMGLNNTLGMNQTAGEIFATTDLLANLSNLNSNALSLTGETSIDIFHLGFKAGKNYVFAGYTQNVALGFDFEKDLAHFAKYGFGDGNGNLNLNYQGDFSDLGVSLDITNDVFVGLQRSFMQNKLRLGVSAHQIGYNVGMRVHADAFNINSTATAVPGRNNVNVNYDFTVATADVLDPTATIDQLSDLVNEFKGIATTDPLLAIIMGTPSASAASVANRLITTVNTTTTFTVGANYKPIEKLSFQFSMSGLGASPMTISTDVTKRLVGGVSIEGFEYISNATDTLGSAVRNEVQSFTEGISNGLNTNLENTTYSYEYAVPQVTNAAMNYHLKGQTYVGVHYTSRTNSITDYEYLGFTSLLWLHKNIQLKGAYYLTMNENNADLITAALQFRVTPLLQVYVGTTTTGDIATVAANSGESIMVGAATQDVNITAGLSMAFFDQRFKKGSKKKEETPTLTPQEVKKVIEAYDQSKTVKINK
jgi:hypothetical protein